MRPFPNRIQSLFCGLILSAAAFAIGATDDDLARPLLMQAMDNQYHGRYQATMEIVNETFADGKDSLAGWAEFADDVGERRMCLAGSKKAFEYKSLNFGKEQWITDDNSQRVRRIANRQWKKGVFGTLLTYEDMLKLPVDFFLEYSSCKGVKTTDSTYQICMTLKPLFQSFYSRIDVTLDKNPVLLRGMTFYGTHGEKLKTLQVKSYKQMEGKWLMTQMSLADNDSLASLQMCFKNFSFTGTPLAQKERAKNLSLISSRPLVIPSPSEGGGSQDSDVEGVEEISN
ncbi:MAG: Outer rane lipoproteinsorting protein [Fibrobacteres bacterium]|nr:Outer rane lipoproteinsorting protein [Fibrobacterota bacterium]